MVRLHCGLCVLLVNKCLFIFILNTKSFDNRISLLNSAETTRSNHCQRLRSGRRPIRQGLTYRSHDTNTGDPGIPAYIDQFVDRFERFVLYLCVNLNL